MLEFEVVDDLGENDFHTLRLLQMQLEVIFPQVINYLKFQHCQEELSSRWQQQWLMQVQGHNSI
jgi:hypothetical protein